MYIFEVVFICYIIESLFEKCYIDDLFVFGVMVNRSKELFLILLI